MGSGGIFRESSEKDVVSDLAFRTVLVQLVQQYAGTYACMAISINVGGSYSRLIVRTRN